MKIKIYFKMCVLLLGHFLAGLRFCFAFCPCVCLSICPSWPLVFKGLTDLTDQRQICKMIFLIDIFVPFVIFEKAGKVVLVLVSIGVIG